MGKKKTDKKMKITFKELLKELGLNTAACRECTTKNDVEGLFSTVFNGIVDAVAEGRTIKVYGFGNFSPKTYAGRTQRSGLEGVPNGIATFGDVKLMKFKLSAMAKDVLAGNERKVRTTKPAKTEKPVAPVAAVLEAAPVKPAKTPKAAKPKAVKAATDTVAALESPAPVTAPAPEVAPATVK